MHTNRFLILLLFFVSCTSGQKKKEHQTHDGGLVEEVKYAKGFSISASEDYYILQLFNPFRDKNDTIYYAIGDVESDQLPSRYRVINTPLSSVVLLASPYAAFLEELNKTEVVTGISTREYFYSDKIQRLVDDEKIIELGFGQNLNMEKIMILDPQLMIFSGMSSSDEIRYALAQEAGITLFPAAEWQELHPLGRAEWIKVFGLMADKYAESLRIFEEIEKRYWELSRMEIQASRPSVIVNAPYKDVWWLPGGKSYVSTLIHDAGGQYVWSDNEKEGGVQIDIETIFDRAHDTEYWINPGQFNSMEELLGQDARYAEFLAFERGNVYNNDLRVNEYGGNDYYETGLVRPEIVLSDLIKIFHPAQMQDHEFYFYRKLP